jgi:hypothetical protein
MDAPTMRAKVGAAALTAFKVTGPLLLFGALRRIWLGRSGVPLRGLLIVLAVIFAVVFFLALVALAFGGTPTDDGDIKL